MNATVTVADAADDASFLASVAKYGASRICLLFVDDQNHANATIEGALHITFGNSALLLQPIENFGSLPGTAIDSRVNIGRQNPLEIFSQTTTGNVGNTFHRNLLD